MEKTMFYTVIKNNLQENGDYTLTYSHYENQNEAYAEYFTACAEGVLSDLPYNAAHIIRSDGIMIEGRVFDNRIIPEIIPEEEETEENEPVVEG